ncbi:deoxyribonuclease, partial [Thermococci archaeon]
TDSPYLSPWRRIENSPVNIKLVLAEVSQIKGLDLNHLKKRIEENQSRIFGDEWFK